MGITVEILFVLINSLHLTQISFLSALRMGYVHFVAAIAHTQKASSTVFFSKHA